MYILVTFSILLDGVTTFGLNFKITLWCLKWEWKYVSILVAFSVKFEEFLAILNGKGNMCMLSLRSDAKTFKYLAISNRKGNMSMLSLHSEVKKNKNISFVTFIFELFALQMDPRQSPLLMLDRQRVLRYKELVARHNLLGTAYRNMKAYTRNL